jgi:hypothetical protein
MPVVLGVVLASLLAAAPLLIAVIAAVCSRDPRRRADARLVVRLLRRSRSKSLPVNGVRRFE